MGWVISDCDLSVTVFYEKAVYVHGMDGATNGASEKIIWRKN
jgi:hypothetical protein